MQFFETLPQDEKVIFIKILSTLAHINNIDDKKTDFIQDIYDLCELKEPSFETLIKEIPLEEALSSAKGITSLKAKRVLIRELFYIAYSDGKLLDAELDFIINIGKAMEVSEPIVLTIGNWVVRSIELEGEGDALFSKDV